MSKSKVKIAKPQMKANKPWYLSLTIWSAIASAVIAGLSAYFGADSLYVAVAIAISGSFGIYGRVRASKPITA